MPERFAGFCGVGFMECLYETKPEPKDGIVRNIWYIVGENDLHDCSLEGDNWNTRTLKMICAANGLAYDLSHTYESGNYMTTCFYNEAKEPIVMYTGIRHFPHSYTPELAFKIYDEFFSKFKRCRDGSLKYCAGS